MADRFPSIEDIDAGQTGADDGGIDLMDGGADTSDFLTRERAALGDDAAQFSTDQDNIPSVNVTNGDNDLLGGGGEHGNNDDIDSFQSSFPAVDARNERVAPGGSITGTNPAQSASRPYTPQPYTSEDEPEVIKQWRERRELAIQHREEVAETRKAETVKVAQEAIDEFYDNYNNKKEKNLAQTKKDADEFLKNRENTTAGGTSWERIAKLVDIRGGKGAPGSAAGKERFRDLLGNLMKDENAPGAKGY